MGRFRGRGGREDSATGVSCGEALVEEALISFQAWGVRVRFCRRGNAGLLDFVRVCLSHGC